MNTRLVFVCFVVCRRPDRCFAKNIRFVHNAYCFSWEELYMDCPEMFDSTRQNERN